MGIHQTIIKEYACIDYSEVSSRNETIDQKKKSFSKWVLPKESGEAAAITMRERQTMIACGRERRRRRVRCWEYDD
ncbi:conserved hypothetical protein [Ricinus communis]|uniref:Uncharacterized protein n=1 Tax=Ricinus communis TaxID=3988 RepID=B9SX22_RICCO|nr:conserved hypothetical protein [Ricinus communis]